MKYVGSKNRLAKELVPIIQSYIDKGCDGYLEPFVGGANMIDKIRCKKKIGCDIHKELIALLNHVKLDVGDLPCHITEEEYRDVRLNKQAYPDWYVGLVGFCATFGAKYFGGYARGFKEDKVTPRDHSNESIRNILKQAPLIKDVDFIHSSFLDFPTDTIKNYIIYCDIPYKGTLEYKNSNFPYDEFYQWCDEMSKENVILVSEYNMPDNFECIWQKEHKVLINSNKVSGNSENIRIEKLFIHSNNK